MKRLLTAALCALLVSGCEAQAPNDVRAPVNVATRLYVDCLQVKVLEPVDIEPNALGIQNFIEGVDDWCLAWTAIWFKPLLGFNLADRPDYVARFNVNRTRVLSALRKELTAASKPR
jgi:hypothetical protein